MYRAYETDLYRFDQLYRHFCEAADGAEEKSWDIVKPMRAEIEAHYGNGYLTPLPWPGAGSSNRKTGSLPAGRSTRFRTSTSSMTATCGLGSRRATAGGPSSSSAMPSATRRRRNYRRTQRQVSLRGHADVAAWRSAVLHGAGHGEPAAAQDAGLQRKRRPGGRQVERSPANGTASCTPWTAWPARPATFSR